jgi:O-antigen/teichoic acid export membrane protein
MSISNNILNASGKKWQALAVVLTGAASVVIFDILFIYLGGFGVDVLKSTALGTSIGMAIALFVSAVFVYKRFGSFWPWNTFFRVVFAAFLAVALGFLMPYGGKLLTLAECIAVFGIYLVVLFMLREFKSDDFQQFKKIFVKKS